MKITAASSQKGINFLVNYDVTILSLALLLCILPVMFACLYLSKLFRKKSKKKKLTKTKTTSKDTNKNSKQGIYNVSLQLEDEKENVVNKDLVKTIKESKIDNSTFDSTSLELEYNILDKRNSKEFTLIDEIYSTLNKSTSHETKEENLKQMTTDEDKTSCSHNKDVSINMSKCTYETDNNSTELETSSSDNKLICKNEFLLIDINKSKSAVKFNAENSILQSFENEAATEEVFNASILQKQNSMIKSDNDLSVKSINTEVVTEFSDVDSIESIKTKSHNCYSEETNVQAKTTLNADNVQNKNNFVDPQTPSEKINSKQASVESANTYNMHNNDNSIETQNPSDEMRTKLKASSSTSSNSTSGVATTYSSVNDSSSTSSTPELSLKNSKCSSENDSSENESSSKCSVEGGLLSKCSSEKNYSSKSSSENDSMSSCSSDNDSSSKCSSVNTSVCASKPHFDVADRFEGLSFVNGWRQRVQLSDMVRMNLIGGEVADVISARLMRFNRGIERGLPEVLVSYAEGKSPIAGVLLTEENRKESFNKASRQGCIRRGTAISLLEAQMACGSILDPITGRKMSLEVARELGFVDSLHENVLKRAQRSVLGYTSKFSGERCHISQAMRKGLISENEVLRLLEVQAATGGVICHRTNLRLPLDVAVDCDVIDEDLLIKLEYNDKPARTYSDPNTEETLPYKELMRRCVLDEDTGFLLLPVKNRPGRRNPRGKYSVFSSLMPSRVVSRRGSVESIPAVFKSKN